MKSFVAALCLFAIAAAADLDKDAQILRSSSNISPDGSYNHEFENNNGIAEQVSAVIKTIGKDTFHEVSGTSQYKNPEGQVIQLSYIANENGFQPQGAHLPTTPAPVPIPEYIQRALRYIAEHPYVEKIEKKL